MPVKTLILFAWRRPEYTRRTLESLKLCCGIEDYRLVASVDGPPKYSDEVIDAIRSVNVPNLAILRQPVNYGVAEHPPRVFHAVKSDFYVSIEDDCLLAPDALHLADWFFENQSERYPFLALGHESDSGWKHPDELFETPIIDSPFAWCFSAASWEWIWPHWNCKTVPPMGWDWSLSYTMFLHQKMALAPLLSRVFNIGREGGVHGTPQWWDEHWGRCVYSGDGQHPPPFSNYTITSSMEPILMKDWMIPEMERGK